MLLPSFFFGCNGVCSYCGDIASSKDHVIPVVLQSVSRKTQELAGNGPYTSCCKQCNSILGSKYFDTFALRCEYIRDYLAKNQRPIIWHAWEIEILDYSLKVLVKKQRAKQLVLQTRIDFFTSREYYLNIENLIWSIEKEQVVETEARIFITKYFQNTITEIKKCLYK